MWLKMTQLVLQIGLNEWLDINAWFKSEMNYILDRSNLEVKTIDQIISKVENDLY